MEKDDHEEMKKQKEMERKKNEENDITNKRSRKNPPTKGNGEKSIFFISEAYHDVLVHVLEPKDVKK